MAYTWILLMKSPSLLRSCQIILHSVPFVRQTRIFKTVQKFLSCHFRESETFFLLHSYLILFSSFATVEMGHK